MTRRARQLTRALILKAQQPRKPAVILPPPMCADPWRDFTESLYPLRFVIGQQLSEAYA